MVLRVVGEVFVLVVVIALRRDDANQRQSLRAGTLAQYRASGLVTGNELLAQHFGVVARSQCISLSTLASSEDFGQANGRAFARWFDNHRHTQRLQRLLGINGAIDQTPVGRGQTVGAPQALGHDFVHSHARRQHARAGIGNAHQFERALHRAVFTVATVQRDKAAAIAFLLERIESGVGRIKGMRIHAACAQRLQHATARHD